MVRQRLGPHRVDLEPRRLDGLQSDFRRQRPLTDAKRGERCDENAGDLTVRRRVIDCSDRLGRASRARRDCDVLGRSRRGVTDARRCVTIVRDYCESTHPRVGSRTDPQCTPITDLRVVDPPPSRILVRHDPAGRRVRRSRRNASVLTVALPSRPFAHEIPPSVTVLAFVKPEAGRLRLVVRVPLESIRDFEFVLRGPGYLDIPSVTPQLRDAGTALGRRLRRGVRERSPARAPPGDRGAAVAAVRPIVHHIRRARSQHVTGPPLADSVDLPWKQAMLDVMIEYPITSPTSRFSIRPALAHLGIRTTTVLRFVPPNGGERVFEYLGDPGLVRLDPRWHQAALALRRAGVPAHPRRARSPAVRASVSSSRSVGCAR